MSFECKECKRTYLSQSSLARHKHNHDKNGEYPCSICNVVFYRADLRARHMNLHKSPASAKTTSSETPGEVSSLKHRRRCHTACVRCRALRIKCSSQRPCDACTVTGKSCESGWDSRRVSRARISPAANAHQTRDETFAQLSPPESSSEVRQGTSAIASANMDRGPLEGADVGYRNAGSASLDISQSDPLFFMPRNSDNDHLAEEAPLEPGGFSQQSQQLGSGQDVSWPWVYESLFLPNDGIFSWPQVSPSDAPEAQHTAHDFLLQSRDESLGSLLPSWGDQSTGVAADHVALGHSYSPALNGAGLSSMPSTSMAFSSGRGRDKDGAGGYSIWQSEALQLREATRLAQAREISTLIDYATDATSASHPRSGHNVFWQKVSPKVAASFDFSTSSSPHVLEQFIYQYLDHFGLLWPLLSRQNLDLDSLHPLLYLVLTSIGAMYGTAAQSTYGRMMHAAIRKTLMLPLEFEDSDDEFVWLAQARLLTQVAALYFGQPKAFSYAQHLGCLLVAQARRLDLFAPLRDAKTVEHENHLGELRTPQYRLDRWLQRESRRRLAFGIFRGDTYTSVLLGIKTLVSPEEIDLELPTCDLVWSGECLGPDTCLLLIEQDRSLGRHLRFSDVYRIAMDQNEPLPALEPTSYELLLFALQGPLWRFSRDPKMFERLTGHERDYTTVEGQGTDKSSKSIRQSSLSDSQAKQRDETTVPSSTPDHLNDPPRQMADLKHEADKLILALQKWKQSLSFVKTLIRSERERGSLLSSLLLYHLSYMRLHAPMEDLHQMEYRFAESRSICNSIRDRVRQWADTSSAYVAAQHACHIWELITKEKQMPENVRAKFNLLAFTGLHHAATVLWSYAGAAQDARIQDPRPTGRPVLELHSPHSAQPSIRICRSETHALLTSFAQLYGVISPARWSSFAKAAEKLSEFQFPLPAA